MKLFCLDCSHNFHAEKILCPKCNNGNVVPDVSNNVPGVALKTSNPKDLIGCNKVPLHLWPESATVHGSLALLEGALKYGRTNWREYGVRSSIYIDACRRHMLRWFAGQDMDPDSGVHNLGHALACLAIIVDAETNGRLVDDRNYNELKTVELLDSMADMVAQIRDKHRGKDPKHYTLADNNNGTTKS